ncbi:MAG: heme ABC exporter ATP-binding protein CcmA [Deltaproteobacteria bacterium]|nr:heme ABC exporter ATP-binding protein CcmA [Deltaproteobacteria bacterium]
MSDDCAVSAERLERRFGAVPVLRGLDLEVARGQGVALFGPNGAGKSTLLRTLAGLLRANQGSVRVFGNELPAGADLRRRIGYLGHESFLYRDLTARENLAYYARLFSIDADRLPLAALEEVGLARFAERRVATFSRGMLQRLALARVFLHNPDLLLLDEPLTGLDPQGGELLARMLIERRKRGVTILMATHDLERALACSTRALVLARGRVAWDSAETLPSAAQMADLYARAVAEN